MEQFVASICEHFVYFLVAACFVISVVVSAITRLVSVSTQERSRREIAAYVAEGSISPEMGERLIRADVSRGPSPP